MTREEKKAKIVDLMLEIKAINKQRKALDKRAIQLSKQIDELLDDEDLANKDLTDSITYREVDDSIWN